MLALRRLGKTGLTVSPIALGTVELGNIYGIGPRNLPSEKEAIALLRKAVDMGITFFDTARFYGCAEERIRKSGITRLPGVIIATKCGHDIEKKQNITTDELRKLIHREIKQSCKSLGVDTLSLIFVHGGTVEQIRNGMIVEIMQKLKEEGRVTHYGISTRGINAPQAAIASGFFEVLQIGYSIFDQRLRNSVLPAAFAKGIGVVARSVFLKGALTPAYRFLPDELAILKQHYVKIEKIAESIGTDVPTLALRFAFSENMLSTVLVGTTKKSNLDLAFAVYRGGALGPDVIESLANLAIHDPHLVDPAYWPATAVKDRW